MITQNLVDLIHSGKGKYQTWATGYTGSQRIPCPKNNYIVITDFTFYNFMDRNPQEQNKPSEPFANCIHNLKFKSYGNEFIYVHRSNFIQQVHEQSAVYMPLTNYDKYDTYQVHKTDVHIDIWRLPDPKTVSTYDYDPLSDKTTEDPNPQGYGTKPQGAPYQNVIRKVDLSGLGGSDFLPYGENQGLPQNPGWREVLRADIDINTLLYPPATEIYDTSFTFPLLNIGYVLVNHPFEAHIR